VPSRSSLKPYLEAGLIILDRHALKDQGFAHPRRETIIPEKYDIVVDVNHNGLYDAGIDALDDNEIQVTAGFFVIPEYPFGTIVGLATGLAALGIFTSKRRHLPRL